MPALLNRLSRPLYIHVGFATIRVDPKTDVQLLPIDFNVSIHSYLFAKPMLIYKNGVWKTTSTRKYRAIRVGYTKSDKVAVEPWPEIGEPLSVHL